MMLHMTRFQLQVLVDVPDGVDLERMKKALANTLERNPRITVTALSGHEVRAPGAPAKVIHEIREYLAGRKARSAHQIARAIKRTDRSVYKPLKELVDLGEAEKVYNAKYHVNQYRMVKDVQQG